MALGMSFVLATPRRPTPLTIRLLDTPDPTLVTAQSEPTVSRTDPNFQTGHPDTPSAIPPSSTPPTIANSSPLSSYMDPTIQDDTIIAHSFASPLPESAGASPNEGDGTPASSSGALIPDVDPQILEALRSKDRIYVLKLGETFEMLITERRRVFFSPEFAPIVLSGAGEEPPNAVLWLTDMSSCRQRVELSPATSYQRLLVHRCSAYYRLAPESDPVTKGIFVLITAESRIPERRIAELVPAESTTQPAFKIMRRSVLDRRNKPHSHAGSVGGDDQELSDVEQSESGSLGGRSYITSSSNKKRMTIEEREAAYNEARSRIFMDFEEKGKDKDISASSSTLSLNGSASTSAGGRSSVGDTDDAVSSPGTESEWSVPSGSNSRDKKDGRRGGPGSASASSTRSLRNGGSFHGNGSGGSSRNSRAPSPSSFSYASLHDSPMGQIYDPSQPHGANQGYYANQYAYPYSPPGPGPSPPFLAPYPYYPQQYNPYSPQPPMPQHSPADPNAPSGLEPYSPPHQMGYGAHYGWPPHPQQPPLQSPPHSMQMPLSPQQQPPQNTHPVGIPPPLPAQPQYQPFMHPGHAYTYPMNGYYQTPPAPGQQGPPPPPAHMSMQPPPQQSQSQQTLQAQQQHQLQQPQNQPNPHHYQQQQQPSYDISRGNLNGNQMGHPPNGPVNHHNPNVPRNGLGNGVIAPNNNGRSTSRNGPGPGGSPMGANGAKNRAQAPPPPRTAWSYGPGPGMGGYTVPVIPGVSDSVGPRFNNSNRRPSGNSSSGSNSRASSANDDVSSTSSSTTSSSSRRTFTSTTSSQHPLPPRPDWAVGLKAQPTLAGGRHHDLSLSNSRTMSPISPPRSNGHNSPMPNESSPRQPASSSSSSSHAPPPVSLQATDFPPLTSGGTPQEKKTPLATGAWSNSRPILVPAANGNIGAPGSASAHHSPVIRQDESVVERPSPKAGEVFNPKLMKRAPVVNGQSHQRVPGDKAKETVSAAAKVDAVVNPDSLAGQVEGLSLGDENCTEAPVATTHDAASASPAAPATLPREKEMSTDVAAPSM